VNTQSDHPFKSNLTFCLFLICRLKNQSFLRRVVDQLFKSNLSFSVFVFLICNLKNLSFKTSGSFTMDNSEAKF
jgi:hypothetical protein